MKIKLELFGASRDFSDKDHLEIEIQNALNIKALKHDFVIDENTKPYIERHMNITGGWWNFFLHQLTLKNH